MDVALQLRQPRPAAARLVSTGASSGNPGGDALGQPVGPHQPIAPGDLTARADYLAFGDVLGSPLPAGGRLGAPPNHPGRPLFGLPDVDIRYGWCGSWGYQNDALDPTGGPGLGAGGPAGAVLGDVALDLGLLHIGARYYSPDIGRWVQRDPIGVGGGINCYVYVANGPVASVDPTGRTLLLGETIGKILEKGVGYADLEQKRYIVRTVSGQVFRLVEVMWQRHAAVLVLAGESGGLEWLPLALKGTYDVTFVGLKCIMH